jgi:hypothetical protein
MKTYNFKGTSVTIKVIDSITPNRIQLHESLTGIPYKIATGNIPALASIDGYVAIKNYSENEGMLEFLIQNDIVDIPVTYVKEDHISFPICKLIYHE